MIKGCYYKIEDEYWNDDTLDYLDSINKGYKRKLKRFGNSGYIITYTKECELYGNNAKVSETI